MVQIRRHHQVARNVMHEDSKPRGMLSIIDKYRMTDQDRHDICMTIWRESLERWWHAFVAYKEARTHHSELMQEWANRIIEMGGHNSEMWPDRPHLPQYPQEIMKVCQGDLRRQVVYRLREGPAASIM
mmetsp:Transcript_120287/g.218606  ORF Transcript_120287/g.218606 Transcript_120287/m.218606 type:complete len:128 (+) Transcript_120287:77-460(+)